MILLFGIVAAAPTVFVVAGLEGSGHHLWNEIGSFINDDVEIDDMKLCWRVLATPRPECTRRGCATAASFDEPVCRPPALNQSLYVPGCSYPCGGPKGEFAHISPDLPHFWRDLQGSLMAIVMIREPVATVHSAFSRRHPESSLRATAHDLFLNLGLLDSQLGLIQNSYVFVHYEDLLAVDAATLRNLAIALDVDNATMRLAIAAGLHRRLGIFDTGDITLNDRFFIESLFYRASSAAFFPLFWPRFRRYKPASFWEA